MYTGFWWGNLRERDNLEDPDIDGRIIRGLFQNQPPIGWLQKYKIENKTLLYGTVTYITASLLHIVAIQI